MKVNGMKKLEKEMEWEYKYGLMDLFMKDFGSMIKQMEREDSFMLIEMFMKEIGKMIRLKVMVFTIIQMVQSMKDNGRKINSMAEEKNHGPMAHYMKANT